MSNPSTLMWGVIWGSVGLGFFVYGKKQKTAVPIFCGVGLMALPYLISSVVFLALAGLVLAALPFLIRR